MANERGGSLVALRWLGALALALAPMAAACTDDGGDPPANSGDTAADAGDAGDAAAAVDAATDGGEASDADVPGAPDVGEPDVDPGTPDVPESPDVAEDTGTPDIGPPAGLLCGDFMDCAFDACADAEGDAIPGCVQEAFKACGEAASQDELDKAIALGTCFGANGVPLGIDDKHFSEWHEDCLPETVACVASEFGTQKCALLSGCMQLCVDPFDPLKFDWACARGCMNEGAEEEIGEWWRTELCVYSYCYDSDDFESCKLNAQTTLGVCAAFFSECAGNEQ